MCVSDIAVLLGRKRTESQKRSQGRCQEMPVTVALEETESRGQGEDLERGSGCEAQSYFWSWTRFQAHSEDACEGAEGLLWRLDKRGV